MIDELNRRLDFPRVALQRSHAWQIGATLLILTIALLLRMWNLGAESLWIDEAYSIALAKHSIVEIIRGTATDQHPPLYYLLLHFWLLFGSGAAYARALSVLIGMIHIGQTLHIGNRLGGALVGLVGGLLLAISPMHVWYSQEVRMYILLVSLTTAASLELWKCLQGKGHWTLYWLFATLSIYTHYFAFFVLLAHGVIVLAWGWKERKPRVLIPWILSILALGIVFLPWLPTAINQVRFHTMGWIAPPTIGEVRDTFTRLLVGNAVLALPDILRWIGAVSILIVLILSLILYQRLTNETANNNWNLSYLVIWAAVPYIAIATIAVVYPIFQFKQFLILLPPLLLWAAYAVVKLPVVLGRFFLVGMFAVGSVSLVYQQVTLTKDDWRGAARYLQMQYRAGEDVIYANPAASELALSQYWDVPLPVEGYPPNYDILRGGWEGVPLTSEIANNELSKVARGHQRLWLVEFSPQLWDENLTTQSWLDIHARLLDDRSFVRIRIRLYQLDPNIP